MVSEIKVLCAENLSEFKDLISIFSAEFERVITDMAQEDHLKSVLEADSFLAMVAKVDGRVVGGLTIHILPQYYIEKPVAYLYDIAVSSPYQRQGIGKELLNAAKNHCCQLGVDEIFVQAEKVDHHAIQFYKSSHPTRENEVIHFDYTF